MSKTIRRIEITAFRRRRLVATGASTELPIDQPMTSVNQTLIAEVGALVKQLAGDTLDAVTPTVSQQQENGDEHDARLGRRR